MFGILVVSASTLGTVGGTVNSAEDAARALEPIAGRAFGWKEGLGRTLRQAPAF